MIDGNVEAQSALRDLLSTDWRQLAMAAAVFLAFLLFRKLIAQWVLVALKRVRSAEEQDIEFLRKAFEQPLRALTIVVGLYFSLKILPLGQSTNILADKIIRSSTVIAIATGLLALEPYYTKWMVGRTSVGSTHMVRTLFRKTFRVVIVALAAMIVADEFINISSFLAGLGIAGLAFAMAAQDTLSAFFAGLSLVMDKPFDIGDLVSLNGYEGFVEDMNLRSTRIRTFAKEVIVIPNTLIAGGAISNYSKRYIRRVKMNIGLTYSTSQEQMKKVIQDIDQWLRQSELISEEHLYVRFEGFGGSSLDILINYYAKTSDLEEYLRIREIVNYEIMRIVQEAGADFAFPSASLYMETPLKIQQ